MKKGGVLLEPPEQWARGFLNYVAGRLRERGFRGGLTDPYRLVYAAIAAGHLTGVDYFYEYAIDAYYRLVDAAESVKPLAEPRWGKLLPLLDEDAEALAEFEERLADSKTVLCSEPVLAAAILGLAMGEAPGAGWRRAGFTGRAGAYPLLVRRGGRRCRVLVPSPVYVLALSALQRAGLHAPGKVSLAVPDPALLRKTVYDSRVAYAMLSEWLRELLERWALRAMKAGDPCRDDTLLKITYRYEGLLEAEFRYEC